MADDEEKAKAEKLAAARKRVSDALKQISARQSLTGMD